MTAMLIILAWLACAAIGFYLFQWWWRQDMDLDLDDIAFGVAYFLLGGPITLLIALLFAGGRLVAKSWKRGLPSLSGSTVVLPKYKTPPSHQTTAPPPPPPGRSSWYPGRYWAEEQEE